MTNPKPTTPEEFGDIPKADFQKHLDDTAEKVSNMPKWKQDVIQGRKPMPTTNEQIALELGWRYEEGHTRQLSNKNNIVGAVVREWLDPEGYWNAAPPDFEHDMTFAGPLLVELVLEFSSDITTDDEDTNFFMFRNGGGGFTIDCCRADGSSIPGVGNEPAEAISRAWLAWRKERVE